jgi:trehalose synthase
MMLTPVTVQPRSLTSYRRVLTSDLIQRIRTLSAPLKGLRVIHVNATANGGGVAEILAAIIPLLRDLGIDAQWYVLPPDDAFFNVTKRLHNWMQGKDGQLSRRDRETYLAYSEQVSRDMRSASDELAADLWVIHDPQPLALQGFVPLAAPAIWRCHIDCSAPNGGVCEFLLPWMRKYDHVLFSLPAFCLDGLSRDRVGLEFPAIDPLAEKNRRLPKQHARTILAGLGIDPERPLVSQVSRFDPWKNPWEAVDSYRLAKKQIPGLQLAMVGVFAASDDPEGPRIYRSVRRYARGDPDIHFFTDPATVGAREINAFQTASAAILQRSTREGFGLTVTEAMWKATPVIGAPVGGIAVQIQDGETGFLATNAESCAQRVIDVVRKPGIARTIGEAARESVRQRFLMPRLLADELELYAQLHRRSAVRLGDARTQAA